MFNTLLKARLENMFFSIGKQGRENNKKGKTSKKGNAGMMILMVLLFLYVGVVFAFIFGSMFYGLATLLPEESHWMFFASAGILAFLLMVIGSVFTAKTQLYDAKDNELLLSMPVPPSMILATRIAALLILNYIFEAIVVIPAGVAYALAVGFTAVELILFIVEFILLGLLSISVISALAFIIELATRKAKHKNLVTMIFSLVFLGAYLWFCSNVNTMLDYVVANLGSLTDMVRHYINPAYHLGASVANRDILSAFIYILYSVIPFALVYFILSKSFIKIATTSRQAAKIKYKEKEMKVSSARWALVKKEVKYFLSLPVYMMNCGLGLIISVAVAVIAVVNRDTFFQMTEELEISSDSVYGILILVLVFIGAMNLMSASSISLEGKRLWIAKSIPVPARDIIMSKVEAHCLVSLPFTVVSGIVVWVGLGMKWYMGLFALLVPSLFSALMAFIGVLINLKMPKLEWINEAVPVKQGGASFVTMLAGMALTILLALPCIILTIFTPAITLLAVSVLLAGLVALFWYITRTCTAKAFMLLGEK